MRDTRIAYSLGMLKEIKYCWISKVFWKKVYGLVCALCYVLSSFSAKLWCLKCTKILVIVGILSNISKALTYRTQVFKVFRVNSQNQILWGLHFSGLCVCMCVYMSIYAFTWINICVCICVWICFWYKVCLWIWGSPIDYTGWPARPDDWSSSLYLYNTMVTRIWVPPRFNGGLGMNSSPQVCAASTSSTEPHNHLNLIL